MSRNLPVVFQMDDDEKDFVKEDANHDAECVEEAMASCPAACIEEE